MAPARRGRRPASLPGRRGRLASSKNRDYQEKRQDYLDYGIREYWIVDPLLRQLTVLIRQGEGANATWAERVFKDADPIESPHLPGLAATVAELWAGV